MRDEQTKVLMEVEVDSKQAINNIQALNNKVEELKESQKKLKDQGQENSALYIAQAEEIKALNKAIGDNTRTIQNDIKVASNAAGSYNALSAQMANLKQQYHAAATEMEREDLAKQINVINDQLKEMDAAQGVFTRNVGNYQSAIVGLIPGFDKLNATLAKVGLDVTDISSSLASGFAMVGNSMSNLVKAVSSGKGVKVALADAGKAMMKFNAILIASPLVLVAASIAAIVVVLKKLSDAIQKNDEAGTNVARLMDSLQPAINLVTDAFAKLADIAGKVAGVLADVISLLSKNVEKSQELTTSIDNLEEAERQYTVNSAKRNLEIAKLEDKVMDKETYNAEQRRDMLQQAIDLEKQNLEDEKKIAEEHLRTLKETAEKDKDTSDDMMNKIAEAEAAVINAETNYYNATKALTKKKQDLDAEILKDEQDKAKVAEEAAKKRAEAYKKAAEARKKAEEEARKKAEDEARVEAEVRKMAEDLAISMIKDENEKALAEKKIAGDREIEQLKNRLATETNLTLEARTMLEKLIVEKQTILDNELQKMQDDFDKTKAEKEKASALKTAQLKAEAAEDGSEEEMQAKKELLDMQMKAELDNAELTEEQKLLIKKKYQEQFDKMDADWAAKLKTNTENALKEATDKAQNAVGQIQAVTNVVGEFFSAINEAENRNLEDYKEQNENKQKILQSRLDSGVISQEEYEKQVTALDEEQAKKEKELQIKQAKRQKAMAIMNATLNAAGAIIASLAQSPVAIGPIPNPAGIASLALATATGAAQIAAAAATKIPTAGKGMYIEGNDHAHGGVFINAEGGEAIINKKATARFLPLLSRINQYGGGVPLYGAGGIAGIDSAINRAESSIDYRALAEACASMNVQVAVTDINTAQGNYAKVESLRTF